MKFRKKPVVVEAEQYDGRRDELYCCNCYDPFSEAQDNLSFRGAVGARWRPCPKPAPGRPLVDCGIGGHMYTLHQLPEGSTYD